MQKESNLWEWLKKQTQSWHIVRIESSTIAGVPDVNYCAETGMEGWIELKVCERWPPSGKAPWELVSQHPLTPAQEFFLTQRANRGSCSGILCQVGKERFFIPASYAGDFNQMKEEDIRKADILEAWLKEGFTATQTPQE